MKRRSTAADPVAPAREAGATPPPELDTTAHSAVSQRRAGPRSQAEAEELYVTARDAWTAAMRAANSGRSADMATLAIAQEAYEAAAAERERWLSGTKVAIPVRPNDDGHRGLEAAIGQEMAWRHVLHDKKPEGMLTRIRRRLGGR